MPKVDIMTTDGEKSTTLELPALFTTKPNPSVLHQVVIAYLANQRQSPGHTKTRGEVAGGGRKPWKQKGTGRARAGSTRSPIWVGGGITFGPRSSANFSQRLPIKMKRLALSMALSAKVEAKKLVVVADLNLSAPKTKMIASYLTNLVPDARRVLMVTAGTDAALLRAAANLPMTEVTTAADLTTYDVVLADWVIMTEPAIKSLEERLTADKTASRGLTPKGRKRSVPSASAATVKE